MFKRPSNGRTWSLDNSILPWAEINGDEITVHDLRAFEYGKSKKELNPKWETRTYNINDLDSICFGKEPFGTNRSKKEKGKAHTFISFGFGDEYLAVSIEVRRKPGETFSPLKSIVNPFEITYVIGDERDIIKLRTNHRKSEVYLYPTNYKEELGKTMFLRMLERATHLKETPEFYNLFTNTCTTNIAKHVNKISPGRIPWSLALLLPAFSDRLAYRRGLIATTKSFKETKEHCYITERAQTAGQSPDFSRIIREGHANL